jgi:hypothetical protein
MFQYAVGEVTELAYVKQIGDQDIARGNAPLAYEGYMELLLSACSTCDKKTSLPGIQKQIVYAAEHYNTEDTPYIDEKSAASTRSSRWTRTYLNSTNRFGSLSTTYYWHVKSNFIPRYEWDKLTQDQKDKLIAKRRQEGEASSSSQSYCHDVESLVIIY